ncbi:hypothetical protein TCAL_12096 [Tigriopus californicus]|uniref:C2H2-type domain-containing protein n=1 Tax=Tigriopus californicus TaxID=6832 RepID=A0A553NPJ7_TIGCA|nr:hypothetical protein TCAL_12096 [Tigriopus californicus]
MWRQQARWQQRQARRQSDTGDAGSSGSQSGHPANPANPAGAGSQRVTSSGSRGPRGHRGRGRGRPGGRGRGRGGRMGPEKPRETTLAKPWIDLGLQSQMRQLDSLLVKAKQSRQAADMDQYHLQRDKVQSIEEHNRMAFFAAHPDEEEFWLPRLALEAGRMPQYCEMCELTFDTAQALSQHEQDHETCGLEGCTFTAGPEQLETHIVDLHASGLYARMSRGKGPAEVEAWRAERKRAWPTHARTQLEAAKKVEALRRVEERNERFKAEQSLINEWVQKRRRDMEARRREIALIEEREGGNPSNARANPADEAPNSVEEARAMNPPKKIPNMTHLPRVQRVNKPANLAQVLFPKLARSSAPKRPSTLLQNLLTKEIREERSELLQCVRFVCQREFFAQGK